jgi:hypothetical protein
VRYLQLNILKSSEIAYFYIVEIRPVVQHNISIVVGWFGDFFLLSPASTHGLWSDQYTINEPTGIFFPSGGT